MICYNCAIDIKKGEHFSRTFDIIETNINSGEKIKKSVNCIACSTKCMQEWYSQQEKPIVKESSDKHRINNFHGGASF